MALTPEQQAARENHITASFAPALMAGDEHDIYDKWLELIGDPTWKPKEQTWRMAWGAHGEPFILDWHQRVTGHQIIRRGEFIEHPKLKHVGCTLDGYRGVDDTVLDSKVCDAHNPLDKIIAFYTPQMIVQRACVGCLRAALLVVHGTAEPHEYPIAIDPEYEAVVWQRIEQFHWCVENFVPPVQWPAITPPEQWRTIDLVLETEINWRADMMKLLQDWNENHDSAEAFETAKEAIKKLLPEDVGHVFFGGLQIKRARNRAVSIKRVTK